MEVEKKLIYYAQPMPIARYYNGHLISSFIFKDVKTGEKIILGTSDDYKEVAKILGGIYYKNIQDANDDFDILWNISHNHITPVNVSFNEVQMKYKEMLKQGIDPNEINSNILNLFEYQEKRKILKRVV